MLELVCPHHLVSCHYNPRELSLLAGGCYNGQVCYWDDRLGGKPVGEVSLTAAHTEPVFKTMWVSSKTGSEFFTASSDGRVSLENSCAAPIITVWDCQILWWDIRNLSQPSDQLVLDPGLEEEGDSSGAEGASVLEYEWTIPSKFMVGTQQGELPALSGRGERRSVPGNVFSCKKKNKGKDRIGLIYPAHFGAVCALQRNPAFPKVLKLEM